MLRKGFGFRVRRLWCRCDIPTLRSSNATSSVRDSVLDIFRSQCLIRLWNDKLPLCLGPRNVTYTFDCDMDTFDANVSSDFL
jgi:hypothetical protein